MVGGRSIMVKRCRLIWKIYKASGWAVSAWKEVGIYRHAGGEQLGLLWGVDRMMKSPPAKP